MWMRIIKMKMKVWTAIESKLVPANAKVITSTFTLNKKVNSTFRARLNARIFEQFDGIIDRICGNHRGMRNTSNSPNMCCYRAL
jgi:hypothetical protein